MNGFLCIDKPLGPSSFAVTSMVRKELKAAKAGHCGTLDPYASGLLVIALGDSTRLIQYLPSEPKVYLFTIRFGYTTDSLDLQGSTIEQNGKVPDVNSLRAILNEFTGTQLQTPPLFSAIKIDGIRAYKLARKGSGLEPAPREITISSLQLCSFDDQKGEATLKLSCSAGTYVRSLARDIALHLDCLGVVSALRRTEAGVFSIDNALKPDNISDAQNYIISTRKIFDNLPNITVDESKKISLCCGKDILLPDCNGEAQEYVFAFDTDGVLVSVLKRAEGIRFHPERVFNQPASRSV